ncbi:proteasome-type protease [Methylococcus sp. EFPC2]|uniref:proteasome-type protease n=1 Tax=Methylococcus sp. EFPC2 TaxID=2812648 RepID=UPI001967A1D8|nr:proteasome-type protease [Methylococcus sp. EFPC2]QSA96179.1 proteasome-type protease [Methylococcus sp. EFPC2]
MTYCLAIKVNDGLVFASDSRTHAGVDYASIYSKMHRFELHSDRFIVLLGAGSLATTQAVVNFIRRDLENPGAYASLNTMSYLFDAAAYVGEISVRVQDQHIPAMQRSGFSAEASFILGGQIQGQQHEIYLIYPQGNYITASPDTPYLQIGETKYGKPILDRMALPTTSLEDASRCAVVSLDSTMRSNLSVGPPVELALYRRDSYAMGHYLSLNTDCPFYGEIRTQWNEGLRNAFNLLPRFDWESEP